MSLLGFFRIEGVDTGGDPAAGPNTGHIELLFSNGYTGLPPTDGNYMTITTALVAPSSRGSVTITSTNPLDPPQIDPNFLSASLDRELIREGVRLARRFTKAPVFHDYIISRTDNATTDAEVDEWVKEQVTSVHHPVSPCSMSPYGAEWGVVDPDLRVEGVKSIRIVDASIIPRIPAAHTQVAVYAFAERASDLVKRAWA